MFTGVIFAILSPAVYGIGNYFDKFLLTRYNLEPLVITVWSGIIAFVTSIILLLVFGLHVFPLPITLAIIGSGFFTELLLLPYFKALSLEDTSTVIPLFQFAPVMILIGDYFLLKESLLPFQYVGAICIIIAGLLLSLEKKSRFIFKPRKAFWFMLLACFCSATAVLTFKYAVDFESFWYILPYEGLGIFLCAVCILFFGNNLQLFKQNTKHLPKRSFGLISVTECIYIFSRYFRFFALSFISASLVSVLEALQPLFVLVYGIILSIWFPHLIKEIITKKTLTFKISAIVLVVLGAVFLSVK